MDMIYDARHGFFVGHQSIILHNTKQEISWAIHENDDVVSEAYNPLASMTDNHE